MHSGKLIFIALTFVATVYATAISRTAARCPERRTVDSQMVGKVNVTTFECVDRTPMDLKAAISRTTKRTDVSSSLTNVARQFQNCAGGATDTTCQCPVLCRDDFCTGSRAQAPAQADCVAIDSEFDRTPGSFFVPSGQGVAATIGTCEAVWINESTAELEYCFENFAQLASVTYTNCVIVNGGGQGGCIAENFLWFFEFLIPGDTILIP